MKISRVLRCTAVLLVFSMFCQSIAFARTPLDVSVTREKVAAIGEGQKCRVKLVDGTQVKGLIVSIHADYLTLKTEGVEEPRRIDYPQITNVKDAEAAKRRIGIGVGIGVLLALLMWLANEMGT